MEAQSDAIVCREAYVALSSRIREIARRAPRVFCGMSACIDATVQMGDMRPLLEAGVPPDARRFADILKDRAARGVGGEIKVDWPEGKSWLSERLRPRYSLGGAGPHASRALSMLGAPTVLNLEDRSERMLAHLPAGVLLAEGTDFVPADEVIPTGESRSEVFIFEYTAGVPVGAVVPRRSTRIIVRFDDPGLEHDDAFERLTRSSARTAGAALVAGFSAVAEDSLDSEIDRIFSLTRDWHASGLDNVHFEVSGCTTATGRDRVIAAVAGSGVTSIGMSRSEFVEIDPGASSPDRMQEAMVGLGTRLGLRRVCVHADNWAASVTIDDPEVEREALMAGCLLAGGRAGAGRPVVPDGVHPDARFDPVPFATGAVVDGWRLVGVPSPYLERPRTTLGLGDTFTAGCLLVFAARRGSSVV